MNEREELIARSDKYLNTGSGEYASCIMRDMAEFIRRMPAPAQTAARPDYDHGYADGVEWATKQYAPQGWHPIETAPKDGTRVFLASIDPKGTKIICECSWWSAERCASDEGGHPSEYEADWYQVEDDNYAFCRPTHWQPALLHPRHALLAQRIEHEPSKLGVEGSNPSERTTSLPSTDSLPEGGK